MLGKVLKYAQGHGGKLFAVGAGVGVGLAGLFPSIVCKVVCLKAKVTGTDPAVACGEYVKEFSEAMKAELMAGGA